MYDEPDPEHCTQCLVAWLVVFLVAFTSVVFSIAWR